MTPTLASLSLAFVTTFGAYTSSGVQAITSPDGPVLFGGTRLFFGETLPRHPLRAACFALDAPLSLAADLILLPAALETARTCRREGRTPRVAG